MFYSFVSIFAICQAMANKGSSSTILFIIAAPIIFSYFEFKDTIYFVQNSIRLHMVGETNQSIPIDRDDFL